MTDFTTPNLPSRNLEATAAFYAKLGFRVAYQSREWMILRRDTLWLEFFPWAEADPYTSIAGCCVRVSDVDALYEAFRKAELPEQGIPRLTGPVDQPWGLREFALVDLDGNLLRCMQPRSS